MAGLLKEIWIDRLMNLMRPKGTFLAESVDMSEFVEYNTINLAEIGADPNVLFDNAVFPVPTASRTDLPKTIPLHTLDTENTVVRNIEEMELAYNKMDSVIRQHQETLVKENGMLAIQNWAPAADGAFTPVAASTGANNAVTGLKTLTFEDIINFQKKFKDLDVDMDELILVLTPQHEADLMAEDLKLYKEVMTSNKLFNFKVYNYSKNPYFTAAGAKKAYGAVPAGTDTQASIAWVKSEVMRCTGTYDVFATFADPGQRGDIIGFQQRFHAMPFRAKYTGAIYSAQAV